MRPAATVALFLSGLLLVLVPGLASGLLAAAVWSVQEPLVVGTGLRAAVARLVLAPAPRGWAR
ncbi:hypothetical protein KBZ21_35805 [Streptomyces sp. A73]|nr:hypothetical protein [Streptomyces sp. A73]